jgi:hypothetical protein
MRTQPIVTRAPLFLLAIVACLSPGAGLQAQTAATPADIQNALSSQYTLTKPTAAKDDIVTAGAVLVLKKDGLLMCATSTQVPATNSYKDGHISQGAWGAMKMPGMGHVFSHFGQTAPQTRKFVAGEKFWVTKITVGDDGIVFDLLSDPISDVRYYSQLKFPYSKGAYPSIDQATSTVAEVLSIQPADNSSDSASQGGQQQQAPASASNVAATPAATTPAAGPATMAPIAPPPPPADAPPAQPKTIALKQTKEQVVAILGPPTKVVNLGSKEIDIYPDMKVTFVNNKVTDVQ